MKKYIIITMVGFFCTFSATAQLRLGIRGGVNISKVHFNKDVMDNDNITGFHIGPVIDLMPNLPFGVDAALLFSRKGFSVSEQNGEQTIKGNYLDVPVNLKYKFALPAIKFYLAAGPYIGFKLSDDNSVKGAYENVSDQWKAKSFQAGVNMGAGVELIKLVQLGVNYEIGLTDNYQQKEFNAKNRTLSLAATVFF